MVFVLPTKPVATPAFSGSVAVGSHRVRIQRERVFAYAELLIGSNDALELSLHCRGYYQGCRELKDSSLVQSIFERVGYTIFS